MKIAVIDTTIDEDLIGGAHTFLPKLFNGLISKGHEVHFLTKAVPNEKVFRQISESGVLLHSEVWESQGFVEENVPVLASWLNSLTPDVYLISASSDLGWAVLPHLHSHIATGTIGHTDSATFYSPAGHYNDFLTFAVGVSPEICESYSQLCGIAPERISWIPYGVHTSQNSPSQSSDNALKLVYVGRLEEEQKRVSDVIKLIRLLSKSDLYFEFVIVGDGEEMPRFREQLSDELQSGKVRLCGWLDGEEVIMELQASEIFILTSAYEGFCIALIESMANGCCPVVTDIRSGNKEMIDHGENGYLIEIGDVETFANTLIDLGNEPSKLLSMRRKAWQTGKKFGVENMVENYQDCFEKAIQTAIEFPREINPEFVLMESCRSRYPLWIRRTKRLIASLKPRLPMNS